MTRAKLRGFALAAAALLATSGCAVTGTYEPRPSARISSVDATGYRIFVRDGERHEVGLLGGGAEELVRGDEAAVTEVRAHRRDRILAWSFLGLGLGGFTAGTILSLDKSHRHDELGAGLYFGAFAPIVASLHLQQPRLARARERHQHLQRRPRGLTASPAFKITNCDLERA